VPASRGRPTDLQNELFQAPFSLKSKTTPKADETNFQRVSCAQMYRPMLRTAQG
jgi:hypothetical protein